MNKKFHVDDLDMIGFKSSGLIEIETEEVERGRWTYTNRVIFLDKAEDKFYEVYATHPATECQECDTYDEVDKDGFVSCYQVYPHQEVVTVYRR